LCYIYKKIYSECILRNYSLETGFSTMILLFLTLLYLVSNCMPVSSHHPYSLGPAPCDFSISKSQVSADGKEIEAIITIQNQRLNLESSRHRTFIGASNNDRMTRPTISGYWEVSLQGMAGNDHYMC
jgi:hypothetical protein